MQLFGARRGMRSNRPSWVLAKAVVDFDFAGQRYYGSPLASAVSVSRASTGYAQTAAGVLVPFAANVLRVTDQGALIEEARTNIIPYSQGFFSNNTNWPATNVVAVDNVIAAPDGTLTGSSSTDNSTNATHIQTTNTSLSFTSGTTYVMSIFAKAGTDTRIQLTLTAAEFSGAGYANFDLSGGTVSATDGTLAGSGIQAYANGWYRCWISAVATATGSAGLNGYIRINAAAATRVPSYAGTGTTIYVWGEQIEAGAFPTSYIPTTSASATRAADVPQLIGPALTAALNAKSAFFQTTGVAGGTAPRLISYSVSGSVFYNSSTNFQNGLTAGANADATFGSGSYSTTAKTAVGFATGNLTAVANGGTLATGGAALALSGAVYLGNVAAANRALNGYMQRFAFSSIKGAFDGMTSL